MDFASLDPACGCERSSCGTPMPGVRLPLRHLFCEATKMLAMGPALGDNHFALDASPTFPPKPPPLVDLSAVLETALFFALRRRRLNTPKRFSHCGPQLPYGDLDAKPQNQPRKGPGAVALACFSCGSAPPRPTLDLSLRDDPRKGAFVLRYLLIRTA